MEYTHIAILCVIITMKIFMLSLLRRLSSMLSHGFHLAVIITAMILFDDGADE